VPALPGVITEGATVENVRAMARETIAPPFAGVLEAGGTRKLATGALFDTQRYMFIDMTGG
jgi:predicted RNase H-like HicB family nuclease